MGVVTSRILAGLICVAVVATGSVADADEKLDAAKQAFVEGNALYKAGKLVQAIAKLEESFKISRNPFLLYNIGKIYDQLGQAEHALFYFKRFLATAPANAPMRAEVQSRADLLVKQGVPETDPRAEVAPTPTGPALLPLQHQPVEATQPHTLIDVTAVMARDPSLTVTLHYRRSDDETFTASPMTWRDADVAGQIPAAVVRGNYLQYYIEARNAGGTVVARSGRATSPHLIDIAGEGTTSTIGLEDPLEDTARFNREPQQPPAPYAKATWISTGVTVGLVATTVVMYALAEKQSDLLREDAESCGLPPCTPFDQDYDRELEKLGRRYNTAYRIALVASVASAGVAGYFWYRRVTTKPPATEKRWVLAPMIDTDVAGLATVGRF